MTRDRASAPAGHPTARGLTSDVEEIQMPDDKSKRAPQDASRVNVHEAYEVRYWCEKWGCTEAQLKTCVQRVGVMAKDVARCLGK